MGYATLTPYSLMEISTGFVVSIAATTVPSDVVINSFTFPVFSGQPNYAYMDVICHKHYNSNALANYLRLGTQFGLKDGGGTFRVAGVIPDGVMDMPGTTSAYSSFVFPGYTNIAQYVVSGGTQDAMFHNIEAAHNNLELYDAYARLRMYFNVV